MRVAMQKVPGVEKFEVRLNQGLTVLDLKPGNNVTLSALRQTIRNNGFPTTEARVVAIGVIAATDGGLVFVVAHSNERFPLAPGASRLADGVRGREAPVEITGTVQMGAKGDGRLAVSAVRVP